MPRRPAASTAPCGGPPAGYEVEAGPRHTEILGTMLGDDRRVVSTPGIKEKAEAPRGQCRAAVEEEAGTFEARMSARTAKAQELQQQIRDLAARLADRDGGQPAGGNELRATPNGQPAGGNELRATPNGNPLRRPVGCGLGARRSAPSRRWRR